MDVQVEVSRDHNAKYEDRFKTQLRNESQVYQFVFWKGLYRSFVSTHFKHPFTFFMERDALVKRTWEVVKQ